MRWQGMKNKIHNKKNSLFESRKRFIEKVMEQVSHSSYSEEDVVFIHDLLLPAIESLEKAEEQKTTAHKRHELLVEVRVMLEEVEEEMKKLDDKKKQAENEREKPDDEWKHPEAE